MATLEFTKKAPYNHFFGFLIDFYDTKEKQIKADMLEI